MAEAKDAGAAATAEDRENNRKVIEGIVKSAKMEKTITVEVNYLQKHQKYGKYVKGTNKSASNGG